MITFNPNGGDLGRASMKHTHPLEFHVILPYIANMLEELHNSKISNLPFYHAFEFSASYKDMFLIEINSVKLPSHVTFYQTDGKKVFELRGASGGVISGLICYLITTE